MNKLIVMIGMVVVLVLSVIGTAVLMGSSDTAAAQQAQQAQEAKVVDEAAKQLAAKVSSGEIVMSSTTEVDANGAAKTKVVAMSKNDMLVIQLSNGQSTEMDPYSAYHFVRSSHEGMVTNRDEILNSPAVLKHKIAWEAEMAVEKDKAKARLAASDETLQQLNLAPLGEGGVAPEPPAGVAAEPMPVETPDTVAAAAPVSSGQVDVVFEGHVKRGPPVIPDQFGLGERLVLVDVLVEHFKIPRRGLVLDEVTYDDLVAIYWKAVKSSGKPAPYPEAH